ncbi:cholinesterase [Protobothrops mucrosquamatus]|uniref:cholinesterase n=1 Tax=Protobothrops mucrosquamatus TaxID=103944 RepID=UPI000775DEC5|nr:cholinesterase [Protobothrops mucrosquamatus]
MSSLLCPSLWWCCLLLLLFPLASSSASNGDTVVITSSGPIKGKQFLAGLGSVTAFLGIPYAEPPVGKLRLQKPLPHQPWNQTLETTSFGNSCPQFIFAGEPEAEIWSPKTPLSEDCLSLNIWVPHPQPSSLVPILIWIHGGGYLGGTSSVDVFNGASLAAIENVIVVTINYRLGALGFLYLPPAAPGNLGLWDQQLALKWIKENAAAFGGDPSRVTIVGQSVGGASVNFHLLAPKSQDLFAQAVIQSGAASAFWAWRSPEEAKRLSLEFVHLLGCSEGNNVDVRHCLQTKNISEFIEHEISLYHKLGFLLNFPFKPTVDEDFLLGDPEKLMEEGQIQVKPILIGKTSDEGGSFVPYVFSDINENLINQEQLLKGIRLLVPNTTEDFVQTIALRFSEGNQGPAQYRSALSHFFADWVIACPLIEVARNFRKAGSPVYAYLFSHCPSGSVWPEWIGASHGAEIPYIFGTLESVLPVNQTYTEAEARLSRKMMQYWAEFARTGNPSGLVATEAEWALYNATEQNFFLLNTESSKEVEKEPDHDCGFLKRHFSKAEDPHKSEGDSVSSN